MSIIYNSQLSHINISEMKKKVLKVNVSFVMISFVSFTLGYTLAYDKEDEPITRKPVHGVCNQARHKPSCTAAVLSNIA